MNPKILLRSLSDGGWHSCDELSADACINRETLLRILSFFSEYGFVKVDTVKEAAKLDESYMKL